jgi:antitoxin FitA
LEFNLAAMTIRKIPDATHLALKRRAFSHGRSVEAEARLILETELAQEPKFVSVADVIDKFKAENGGGFDLPYMKRSGEIEPATFE